MYLNYNLIEIIGAVKSVYVCLRKIKCFVFACYNNNTLYLIYLIEKHRAFLCNFTSIDEIINVVQNSTDNTTIFAT